MAKRLPLTNKTGEVRELSDDDFQHATPFTALPDSLKTTLSRRARGSQKSPVKERITIRLSPEVVAPFRATGEGWQTRLDAALKDWLKTHTPS